MSERFYKRLNAALAFLKLITKLPSPTHPPPSRVGGAAVPIPLGPIIGQALTSQWSRRLRGGPIAPYVRLDLSRCMGKQRILGVKI